MISVIRSAIQWGGDQAIAASRGEGKTTIFERLMLKYVISGAIGFAVLCAATGEHAAHSLEAIRDAITENDRLAEDYPEVCVPVRALENTPNRAHYQIVTGKRHDNGKLYERHPSCFSWCGREIVFPDVPGSPSALAIIATRGLDAAVRGLKRKGRRPEVVGIDDPDTEESARSEDQAKKLEDRIDRALGGLGGQQRVVARVMLTTLQSRTAASFTFTDPKSKPTWKGRRFRYLLTPPDRVDLWDEYIALRRNALESFAAGTGNDEHARAANTFYLANRKTMDAGAELANPNRFDSSILPDGSAIELSSLQRYYNEIARLGAEAVATEYDNDPPEVEVGLETAITAHRVQTRVSGHPRREIPPGCILLTQGIDARKIALHWVVRAWRPDGIGYTIDYGVEEVHGTTAGSDEGVDHALTRAIHSRMETLRNAPYAPKTGPAMEITETLIDAGWRTDAIYRVCAELKATGFAIRPAMGFGKSNGVVKTRFTAPVRTTTDRKTGDGWFLSRKGKRVWLVCMDADRWKAWEHDRWLTPIGQPGAMQLWGDAGPNPDRLSDDQKSHHSYARHIVSEVEVEEVVKGVIQRGWKTRRENNHWLDASYMADVAAAMHGITIGGVAAAPPTTKQQKGWFDRQ